MRKFLNSLKALFVAILAFTLVFSFASCDKNEKHNTSVPYGTLESKGTYATLGTYSISYKDVYDQFRMNAYDTLNEMIIKKLLKANYDAVNNNFSDYYYDLVKAAKKACYSTDDDKKIAKMASNKETYLETYRNTLASEGVYATTTEIETVLGLEENLTDVSSYVDNQILNHYKLDVVKKQYAISLLNEETKLEKIADYNDEDADGDTSELIENANYIDFEKAIQDKYDTDYKDVKTYQLILLQFKTLREAQYYMDKAGITTAMASLNDYLALYEAVYGSYKDTDVASGITYEASELTSINALVKNAADALGNDEFIATPVYYGSSYILMYKVSETLKDAANPIETVQDEIKNDLIEAKATSSYITSKINLLVKNATIEIYDPIYDVKFVSQYGVKYTDNSSDNNVALINNEAITVEDLFNEMAKVYGVDVAIDLGIKNFISSNVTLVSKLDSEKVKEYNDTFDALVKSFEKNEVSGFPKSMGKDNFLVAKFGFTNKDDIINKYYAINDLKSLYFDTYDDELFTNLKTFTDKAYDNYVDITINHILIAFDVDGDGSYEDPEYIINELEAIDPTKADAFEAFVLNVAKTIVSEVNYYKVKVNDYSLSPCEALAHIVDCYNYGKKIESATTDTTWDEFRDYGMVLVNESLGQITDSSIGNYVKPFQNHVRKLYQAENSNSSEYLEFADPSEISSLDDLCTTNYGYHLLIVENKGTKLSAKYEESEDANSTYKEIKLYAKDADKENDEPLYVVDGYSSTEQPSINQLKAYYYQGLTSDGVNLDSTVKKALAAYFDNVLSRYQSTENQYYVLYQALGEIDFTDANLDSNLDYTHQLLIAAIDGVGQANAQFDGWFDVTWNH